MCCGADPNSAGIATGAVVLCSELAIGHPGCATSVAGVRLALPAPLTDRPNCSSPFHIICRLSEDGPAAEKLDVDRVLFRAISTAAAVLGRKEGWTDDRR